MPVLVISMHDEAFYAERVLRAGGRGYVMKQEGGKKIMEAIRQVFGRADFCQRKNVGQDSGILFRASSASGQFAGART